MILASANKMACFLYKMLNVILMVVGFIEIPASQIIKKSDPFGSLFFIQFVIGLFYDFFEPCFFEIFCKFHVSSDSRFHFRIDFNYGLKAFVHQVFFGCTGAN